MIIILAVCASHHRRPYNDIQVGGALSRLLHVGQILTGMHMRTYSGPPAPPSGWLHIPPSGWPPVPGSGWTPYHSVVGALYHPVVGTLYNPVVGPL